MGYKKLQRVSKSFAQLLGKCFKNSDIVSPEQEVAIYLNRKILTEVTTNFDSLSKMPQPDIAKHIDKNLKSELHTWLLVLQQNVSPLFGIDPNLIEHFNMLKTEFSKPEFCNKDNSKMLTKCCEAIVERLKSFNLKPTTKLDKP